jgi:uncharacterized RDD family membrane protein YckC
MKRLALWYHRWIAVLGVAILGATATAAVVEVEQAPDTANDPAKPDNGVSDNPVEKETPALPTVRTRRKEVVAIGRDVYIGANEISREVVVVGGQARIDGEVRGDVVVISGKAYVNGRVEGSVVSVLGGVTLGSNARIRDNVVAIGGTIHSPPRVRIGGDRVEVPLGLPFGRHFRWLDDWMGKGLFFGRLLPHQFAWAWGAVLLSLLVYVVVALVFPGPLQQCVESLENQPFGSMVAGVLAFLLIGPVIFLLIITLIGILAVPFLICGLIAAFIFGKVAVYRFTGEQLARQMGMTALSHPLWALTAGMGLFSVVYMLPVLGFLAWGLVSLLGFGAVLITLFGGAGKEKVAIANLLPSRPAPPSAPGNPGPATPPPAAPEPSPSAVPPVPPPGPFTAAMAAFHPSAAPSLAGAMPAAGAVMAEPMPPLEPSRTVPPLVPPPASPTGASAAAGRPGLPPIATPPPVDFSTLPQARFSSRIWAALIDVIFVEAFIGLCLPSEFMDGPRPMVFLLLVYFGGMWAWRGTSLGGIVMKLKVVRLDGRPLKPEVAIIRALAGVLSCVPLGLGFLWAAWDKDRQTWHDKIAGTLVVSVPSNMPLI